MYCGHCGANNPGDAKFCGECGKLLSKPVSKKYKIHPVLIIALVGLVVVFASVVWGMPLLNPWFVPSSTPTLTAMNASTFTLTFTPTSTATPSASETPTLGIGSTWTRPTDGMVMVYVSAGEFTMGNKDAGIPDYQEHVVYLDGFWIDKTEVTNSLFALFVERTGYLTDAETIGNTILFNGQIRNKVSPGDWRHPQGPSSSLTGLENHPVVQVSWNDAVAYCKWAGARLLTEAEWEKAARGVDAYLYPWGNQTPDGSFRNFGDISLYGDKATSNDGYKFTAPVGSFPKDTSPYQVLDMAGNVGEWVKDLYNSTYYANSPYINPQGPVIGNISGFTDLHVIRGGSFRWGGDSAITFIRFFAPLLWEDDIGFRCGLTSH